MSVEKRREGRGGADRARVPELCGFVAVSDGVAAPAASSKTDRVCFVVVFLG